MQHDTSGHGTDPWWSTWVIDIIQGPWYVVWTTCLQYVHCLCSGHILLRILVSCTWMPVPEWKAIHRRARQTHGCRHVWGIYCRCIYLNRIIIHRDTAASTTVVALLHWRRPVDPCVFAGSNELVSSSQCIAEWFTIETLVPKGMFLGHLLLFTTVWPYDIEDVTSVSTVWSWFLVSIIAFRVDYLSFIWYWMTNMWLESHGH